MERARSSSSTSHPSTGAAETAQTPEERPRKGAKDAVVAKPAVKEAPPAPPIAPTPSAQIAPESTANDDDAAHEASSDEGDSSEPSQPFKDVPVDWEALEDAFENNAPEVHSYLQLATGEVIRVVDGVADPQMHARIAADAGYLRVDPVSSREQYRWMERFIPMVENLELRARLNQAIDGKGAFRRFKDVLMAHAEERERWFTYRSERLKTFMDAWLTAHSLRATARPAWVPIGDEGQTEGATPEAPISSSAARDKRRSPEALRKHLREVSEMLGQRDLDTLSAFADFLRTRRVMRGPRADEGDGHDGELDDAPPSFKGTEDSGAEGKRAEGKGAEDVAKAKS